MAAALIATLALLVGGIALAQQAPVQPVDPVGDGTVMVRFLNLSPNADPAQISMTNSDGAAIAPTELSGLGYGEVSVYIPIPVGSYDLTVTVGMPDGALPRGFAQPYVGTSPQRVDFVGESRYTVALIGLLIPESFEGDDNEGFWGWLRGLFTTDSANRDALALRIEVLADDLDGDFPADEARVRIVHAAPGLAAVDLTASGDRGVVVGNLAFGETSGYQALAANETVLQVLASDSQVAVADLGGETLEIGSSHTIFVIGTPVEDIPVHTLILSNR